MRRFDADILDLVGILRLMGFDSDDSSARAPGDATVLLSRLRGGDSNASTDLLPIVYEHLRAMAGGYLRGQRPGHTLQPTALVHEVYLKLVRSDSDWKDRAHFCAVAATAMRQILMNHARAKRARKRDANAVNITLDQLATPSVASTLDLVALEDALEKLGEISDRLARLIELRFFGGLQFKEIALVLDLSLPTVERDWRRAKAWLNRELSGASPA